MSARQFLKYVASAVEEKIEIGCQHEDPLSVWEPFVITKKQYRKITEQIQEKENYLKTVQMKVNKAAMTYDLLLKHNSLDGQGNPIQTQYDFEMRFQPELEKRTELFSMALEKVISQAMEDPEEWLSQRRSRRQESYSRIMEPYNDYKKPSK